MPEEGNAGKETSITANKQATEIVVSNRALQVAKAWVRNMTGGADSDCQVDDDSAARETVVRPARLGLGAKYLSHSQVAGSMNPIEKKLRRKVNAAKRDDSNCKHNGRSGDLESGNEEDDEMEDSKTSTFGQRQRNSATDLFMPTSRGGKRKRNENK